MLKHWFIKSTNPDDVSVLGLKGKHYKHNEKHFQILTVKYLSLIIAIFSAFYSNVSYQQIFLKIFIETYSI